jgi:hypothetical protein
VCATMVLLLLLQHPVHGLKRLHCNPGTEVPDGCAKDPCRMQPSCLYPTGRRLDNAPPRCICTEGCVCRYGFVRESEHLGANCIPKADCPEIMNNDF